LTVINGNENENDVDPQNENNTKIKVMSYTNHQNPYQQQRYSYRQTGLLAAAETVQLISYVWPRSAVRTGVSDIHGILRLWVDD